MAELYAEHPLLADRAAREAAADPESAVDPDSPGLAGMEGRAEELSRYLRWAALFGKNRLALTRAMVELYPDVDLFTPMLVDLQGLNDQPETTVIDQLKLQERLSRLGILGHDGPQVHPFVGFDPRRLGALPLVQLAITSYGCVGVKLYPPMGFLPIGNVDDRPWGMSPEEAMGVEAALESLYTWCVAADVPITAHSNPTNYAHDTFMGNSSPERWERVLQRWPDLRLNLGHFGWHGQEWPERIATLMGIYPHLYADIGNHDLTALSTTVDRLERLYNDEKTKTARERFMFGTDWYMVAMHHRYQDFLTEIRGRYAERFADSLDRFMGRTALSFLGFDNPRNANNHRVRARYEQNGAPAPEWLAA